MRIQFAKWFYRPQEGDMFKPSIIAYRKVPWVGECKDGVDRVIQHKYWLYINLWFVEIVFDWLSPKTLNE